MSNLKFAAVITPYAESEGGGYRVTYVDLPGCSAQGATPEEALRNGEEAIELWKMVAESTGVSISTPPQLSGKILLRVEKSIHRDLTIMAKRGGISLNEYIKSALASHLTEEWKKINSFRKLQSDDKGKKGKQKKTPAPVIKLAHG